LGAQKQLRPERRNRPALNEAVFEILDARFELRNRKENLDILLWISDTIFLNSALMILDLRGMGTFVEIN
jgi:hypothetical protein